MSKMKSKRICSLFAAALLLVTAVPYDVFAMGFRQEDKDTAITDLQVGDWLESDKTYTLGSSYTDTEGNTVEYGDKIVFYTYGNTQTENGKVTGVDLSHKREGFYTAERNENGQYAVTLPQSVSGNDILINDMATYPASDITADNDEIYEPNEYKVSATILWDSDNRYNQQDSLLKSITICTPDQQTPKTYTAEELIADYFNGNSLNMVIQRDYGYYDTQNKYGDYIFYISAIDGFTNKRWKLFCTDRAYGVSSVKEEDCKIWSDYADLTYEVNIEGSNYLDNAYEDMQPRNLEYCEIDGLKYVVQNTEYWLDRREHGADITTHEENGVVYLDTYKGYVYPQNTYVMSKDGIEYHKLYTYIEEKEGLTGSYDHLLDNLYGGFSSYDYKPAYTNPTMDGLFFALPQQNVGNRTSLVKYSIAEDKYLETVTYVGCGLKPVETDETFITDLKCGDILEGGKTYHIFRTELGADYETDLENNGYSDNKNDMQSHWSYGSVSSGNRYYNHTNSFARFGANSAPVAAEMLMSDTLSGYLFNYTGNFVNKDGSSQNFATLSNTSANYEDQKVNIAYHTNNGMDSELARQNYMTIRTPEGYNWRFDGFEVECEGYYYYTDKYLMYNFTPLDINGNEVKTVSVLDVFTGEQISFSELSGLNWDTKKYLDTLFSYDKVTKTYSAVDAATLQESCVLYAFPKNLSVTATDYTDNSKKGTINFSYNDNFDGTDTGSITWNAQTDGEFGSDNYPWQYATLVPDWYWIELYSMKKEYSLSELTMCYKDGVKLIPQNITCTVLDGNTLNPVDMSAYKETPYWKIEDLGSAAESASDITYKIVMPEDFVDDYPLVFVYAENKQNVYTEGISYTTSYDNLRYENSAYKNIHVGKKIRGTDASCTTDGEAVYFAEKVDETWETKELADVLEDSTADVFETTFSSMGYDKDKDVCYHRVDADEYPKPISETYNMCLSLKEIKAFEDLKDVNGNYTGVYVTHYRYPRMAVIPGDSGVTVMYSNQYTTSLPTGTYAQNANSFIETFTTVEDYNNFVKAFMGTQGTKVINSAYDINIAFINESVDIGVNGTLTTKTKYTTNLTDKENEIYCYMTALNKGPLEHTIKTSALGHTWSTDESAQVKIDIDNPAQDAFIGKVASTNSVPVPATRDDAITLLCTYAENGSTIDISQLTGNNVLYGTFCTRAQDAFELKTVHEHSYKEPVFDWSKDYSSCTATLECIEGDDTQTLPCTVTKTTTPATCTKDGETKYVASVTFNGKTYTDTKTVPLDKLGHSYKEPVFNWSNDDTECEAVFECIRKDDTQTLPCRVTKEETPADYTKEGKITYTASVKHENTTYTDTKTRVIPKLTDTQAPQITVIVKDNQWKEFLNNISFGLFFNKTQDVIITAEDICTVTKDTPSGIKSMKYYLADSAKTLQEIRELPEEQWQDYEELSIYDDGTYIVYAKAEDYVGNTGYASSDGMVYDTISPVISETEENTPLPEKTITVTDDTELDFVEVNGEKQTLTGNAAFTTVLKNDTPDKDVTYIIKAADKAGNETEKVITLKAAESKEDTPEQTEPVKEPEQETPVSPKTGDFPWIAIYLTMLMAGGIISVIGMKRKKIK